MRLRFAGLFTAILSTSLAPLLAQPAAGSAPVPPAEVAQTTPAETVRVVHPEGELGLREAVILGLVEGITEFLPVSSTGHLIVTNEALKLNDETPLVDATGVPLWQTPPSDKNPHGQRLTLKAAADTYIVIIQVGAIAAVLLLYSGQLLGILRGLGGRNAAGLRLLRNIFLAFFPCALLGFFLHEWIDAHLFSVQAVIVALISGAVLMLAAERWRREQPRLSSNLDPADLTAPQSLTIGLMQCLALWPGMSRSMVTMVGGYFAGLTPAKAAEFSFLVGLPTLAGAAFLKGVKTGPAMIQVFGWTQVIAGALVAALSAGLAVTFLVRYLARHGLGIFATYRVLLAALLAAWFFL